MANLGNNEFTSLTAVLRRVFSQWARNTLYTSAPGKIVSYDAATKTATVLPSVGNLPELDDVPVLFPGNSQGVLEFNLMKGDHVWIFWSKFDLIKWRENFELMEDQLTLFDGSSAVCLPWSMSDVNLLDRLLPEGGNPGQVCKRTSDGYRWADDDIGRI